MREAVESGTLVVACAYTGHAPEELLAQLPAGFNARQFVAMFKDGKLVNVKRGMPEQAVAELLGATPVDATPAECIDCEPSPAP
ncbi:MAG: hypothetical protein IT464_06365 [Planctomycetes bacterium]|nr:hypothetical protein [Planctomycetota bacterium]